MRRQMVFEKGMCSKSEKPNNDAPPADGNDLNGNKKAFSVLIVDDDAVIRTINQMIMSRLGFEVQAVVNGKEAVDLHLTGASFDLILMDMEMPVMDGPHATMELRSMGIGCPIIGVTCCTSPSDKKKFMDAGLNDCLEKPFVVDKIACFLPIFDANSNNN